MLVLALTLAALPASGSDTLGDTSYYLGDIHAHSGVSGDGGSNDLTGTCRFDCGDFEDIFQTARDNGLDFAAVSDHVNGLKVPASASDYADLVDLAIAENDVVGGFITLPAAEVWLMEGGAKLGHKTLLMFGEDADLATFDITDAQPIGSTAMDVVTCGAVETWATNLEASFGHVLLVPHHPAASVPMPTDWDCHSELFEPMVEVYSEHGNSMGDSVGYDDMWSGDAADSTVHEAIDPDASALRLGFGAGTDKHNSRPGDVCELDDEMPNHPYGGGLTLVAIPTADGFDREQIYDAMQERRTIATTGTSMPVAITFTSGGAALGTLGDELGLPVDQDLDVDVEVPADLAAYVTAVDLVTPEGRFPMTDEGGGLFDTTITEAEAGGWVYAAVEIDGDLWYGTAGCDDGGLDTLEYEWTSPSYIDSVAGDLDGDGQTYLEGDCDDGDASVYDGAGCGEEAAEIADTGAVAAAEEGDAAVADTGEAVTTEAAEPDAEEAVAVEEAEAVVEEELPTSDASEEAEAVEEAVEECIVEEEAAAVPADESVTTVEEAPASTGTWSDDADAPEPWSRPRRHRHRRH
ncbi:hypothetical protein LBMAG42_18690 [Deltaproteobacteria bacterium]|nr:hypothetical protein LBMAG42_18690 [Deltaproteobacteria bacterium]